MMTPHLNIQNLK